MNANKTPGLGTSLHPPIMKISSSLCTNAWHFLPFGIPNTGSPFVLINSNFRVQRLKARIFLDFYLFNDKIYQLH